MQKIINLTNSPYDLAGAKGTVRLPAFGSVEGKFSDAYLDILSACGAVTIETIDAAPSNEGDVEAEDASRVPQGADERPPGDAEDAMGTPEEGEAGINALREEYRTLSGKDADKRWAEKRLADEIEKLKG